MPPGDCSSKSLKKRRVSTGSDVDLLVDREIKGSEGEDGRRCEGGRGRRKGGKEGRGRREGGEVGVDKER